MQSRYSAISAATACALSFAAETRADLITFDPDGAGGVNAPLVVGALDMAPGNTLLQQPALGVLQFNHQASLMGLLDSNGTPIATPGLNSTFEITVVSRVLFLEPSFTNDNVVPASPQPGSFIEIWYDITPDANSLAGTGYNDGTRIYFGSPDGSLPGLAAQADLGGPSVPYDQFGIDNYPGETTTLSTGSYFFGSTTTLQDAAFFLTPLSSVELTTGIDTPFDMTNPSAKYVNAPGGAAPVPGGFTIGAFPHQADGALQFTAVPEPASLAVLSLGAAMLVRRRGR